MRITVTDKPKEGVVPVLFLKEGQAWARHPFFQVLDASDKAYINAFLKKTPLRNTHNHLLFLPSGKEMLLIGLPEKKAFTHRKAILAARRVVTVSRRERIARIAVTLEDLQTPTINSPELLGEIMATQWEIANFEFVQYKTTPKEGWKFVEEIEVIHSAKSKKIKEALEKGKAIGEEINKARVLSNTPGGDMTPARLAEAAIEAGKAGGMKVTVLDEEEIKTLGMGGVLGVSKGSAERPKFIVMEYLKDKKSEKPIVLVGKGVTFDTGGLNLKPEHGIYEMHMDMSGGAAVIHIIAALARLKIKKNIVGLIPAVENMPSGSSYHPGDQLKTLSGKTIEVLNTDAEGRIILADALTYALRFNPRLVVDIATLTGSSMAALGQRATALFTTEPKLETILRKLGEETGDFVWPLPLWEEYEEEIKGTFGDVANMGKTRYGGVITAAVFLWQFIKEKPWIHLDIAPRMTSVEGEYLAKGSAGASIALLVSFLKKF